MLSVFLIPMLAITMQAKVTAYATGATPTPAPTFVASAVGDTGNGAIAPGVPAGVTGDDVLICLVQSSNEAISAPTNVGGTNWTTLTWQEVTNSPQHGTVGAATTGAVRLGVFWVRIPTSGTVVGTVSIADTGNHTVGRIFAFRGCITTGNPWDVTAGSAGGAAAAGAWFTLPNVTTTVNNTLIFCTAASSYDNTGSMFGAPDWTATNVANPSAGNLSTGITQTATGTGGGVIGFMANATGSDLVVATAGTLSTGANGSTSGIPDPATSNGTAASQNWVAITIALRPPP